MNKDRKVERASWGESMYKQVGVSEGQAVAYLTYPYGTLWFTFYVRLTCAVLQLLSYRQPQ